MTCREFWIAMPEFGAEAKQHEHIQNCASCAAILDRHAALAAGLRQLAQSRRESETPAHVEARLLKAFRAQARLGSAAQVRSRRDLVAWLPAIAAMVGLAFFLVLGWQAKKPGPVDFAILQSGAELGSDDSAAIESDFIPSLYASGTSPAEDADWVRVAVPGSTLVALGLPIAVDGGSGPVEALVALGADGVVQGVRLLQQDIR